MTQRIFRAVAMRALKDPYKTALRSGERCIDYAGLASFLAESANTLAG
jgi:hypothetical protein